VETRTVKKLCRRNLLDVPDVISWLYGLEQLELVKRQGFDIPGRQLWALLDQIPADGDPIFSISNADDFECRRRIRRYCPANLM
jgi:hypothetical protein